MVQKKVLDRIQDSGFFGSMIDESMDISVPDHFVVFASFVKEILSLCINIGLLHIKEEKKCIFNIWNINKKYERMKSQFDKCVGFGFDGPSTMIGMQNGVAKYLNRR